MASSLRIIDNTESKCSQEGKIDTNNSVYIIYSLSYFLNIHQSILPFYFVFLCNVFSLLNTANTEITGVMDPILVQTIMDTEDLIVIANFSENDF